MRWLVAIVLVLAACTTDGREHRDEMAAACVAQNFLRENGYLDQQTHGPVAVGILDGVEYRSADGSIDWARLGADRHGTFARRLAGVTHDSNQGYTVFYRTSDHSACVAVAESLDEIRVIHAQCRGRPEIAITEQTLSCVAR